MNQKGFIKITLGIIIAVVLALSGYFIFKSLNKPQDKVNPQNYHLESYSIEQSPVYNKFKNKCSDDDLYFLKDFRIVNEEDNIIISSLLSSIYSFNQIDYWLNVCRTSVDIFSKPSEGRFIYLKSLINSYNDAPSSNFNKLYRLNLSDLTIKELEVSNFVRKFDLYRNNSEPSYKVLKDKKRLIKWNMDGVYLVNLEDDSKSKIYTTPDDQWLISNIIYSLGHVAEYNIQFSNNEIIINVYDKTITEKGNTIKIDQHGNVSVDSDSWNRRNDPIKPKFIKKVSVPVPYQ